MSGRGSSGSYPGRQPVARDALPETRDPIPDTRPPNACLIANPAAGRGRAARRLPEVRAALAAVGITDVRLTRHPGEERLLAARAAGEGIETIVALGGDGTWGNVARGILESGKDARLVPIAGGTGNDFPHALDLPAHDAAAMARIAVGTGSTRTDVGWVNDHAFLNVAGFGLQTSVLQAIAGYRRLRGPLVYVAAALPLLRSYPGLRATIQCDGEPPAPMEPYCVLVISNGPRFGGGFPIAPGALVTDGQADLVTVRDAPPIGRLRLFVRARLGVHVGQPEVSLRRLRTVSIRFDRPVPLDVDGELQPATATDFTIRVQHGALRIGT